MTPQETLVTLSTAEALDPLLRLRSDEDRALRAAVWADTLHPNMTPNWATGMIKRHYARTSGIPITAAELNRIWADQNQPATPGGPGPGRLAPGVGPAAYRAELARIQAARALKAPA